MKKLMFLFIFINANLIRADGGFIPPQGGYEIYSSDQVAIIKLLPDSIKLSILVKAQWVDNYNGFAWIVPLPSLPLVNEVDVETFTDLAYLTAPLIQRGGCGAPFTTSRYTYGEGINPGEDYYDIIEYDTIGFLQTVLIHTDLADSLANWLTNNNYVIPEGASAIFQEYIDRAWNYFFIGRANTAVSGNEQNVGIKFTFATDVIVYPMRISSISSYSFLSLYLYVIGEHKMFFEGAELEYANRISAKEFDKISEDFLHLSGYIEKGSYITKLKKDFHSPGEMFSDIQIYQSPDDTEFRKIEEEYRYFGLANGPILPFFILIIYIALVATWRANKKHRK